MRAPGMLHPAAPEVQDPDGLRQAVYEAIVQVLTERDRARRITLWQLDRDAPI